MNNLSSYCGLVDARISASDKYLPVKEIIKKVKANITLCLTFKLRHIKKIAGWNTKGIRSTLRSFK